MFKQVIAFIFLVAFALQSFNRAIIVFDYAINTKVYAKSCENKARPKMHCNGKCQMMKKLDKEEKKDQQNPERKSENKNELIFAFQSFSVDFTCLCINAEQFYSSFQYGKEKSMPRSIFHPPAIA